MNDPHFELAGYEILGKLGEGGMAVVWKARQISLDRLVAIKTLAPQWLQDPDALARFRLEAHAAARLKHSGIVQVFDAGETKDVVYYIMEYIHGYTIADRIERKGALDQTTALQIALGVASALDYAWQTLRIIHCDIKPDNIMIDHDGTVKVADLGLARALGQKSSTADQDFIVGTPNYTSPEQARGDMDLDCSTDIYALGATLYQMVTGRLPFGDTPGTTPLDRQQTDFLLDPLDLNPQLSAAIATLIEKMMIKDRRQRPSSWDEVLRDIQEVEDGFLPTGALPEPGASTVLRGEWRSTHPGRRRSDRASIRKRIFISSEATPAVAALPSSARSPLAIVLGLLLLLALLVALAYAGLYAYLQLTHKIPAIGVPGQPAAHNEAGWNPPRPYRAKQAEDLDTERTGARSGPPVKPAAPPAPTSATPESAEPPPAASTNTAPDSTPEPAGSGEPGAVVSSTATEAAAPNAPNALHHSGLVYSPHYLRAARFFNYAIDLSRRFSGSQLTLPVFIRIEAACRQAMEDFAACDEARSNPETIARRLQDCNRLLANARLTTKLAPPVSAASAPTALPPLPGMALAAGPRLLPGGVKTPAPVAPATTPSVAVMDEKALAATWKKSPVQRTPATADFRDLFALYPLEEDQPGAHEDLIIYDRIHYGMPARAAAELFGQAPGGRLPITSPLFPPNLYFYYLLSIPPVNDYARLLLIVDPADRVVAVQLVNEQPAEALQLPVSLFQSRWRYYDFVRNAEKSNLNWKIGYRVALVGRLARLDSEMATDDSGAAHGLGVARARSCLYLPQTLACRIFNRIERP